MRERENERDDRENKSERESERMLSTRTGGIEERGEGIVGPNRL